MRNNLLGWIPRKTELGFDDAMVKTRIDDNVIQRTDSMFWDPCKNLETPPPLVHKLQLFKETGRVYLDDGDIFRVDSWTQVM